MPEKLEIHIDKLPNGEEVIFPVLSGGLTSSDAEELIVHVCAETIRNHQDPARSSQLRQILIEGLHRNHAPGEGHQ